MSIKRLIFGPLDIHIVYCAADKSSMGAKKFEYFEVSEGRYCLVPENNMPELLEALELINFLDLSKSAKSLSFLVKFYRFKLDLSKQQLAIKAKLSRHTITNIEDNHDHPTDLETVKTLANYFSKIIGNDSFKIAANGLGFKF